MKPSTIKEYFEGQSIFITGCTGTLGKILVEKLLRCCPGVKGIYLLIREKKNVPIEERWKQITELALFDVLKESNPKALEKVILIRGDIQEDEMGLSEDDKEHYHVTNPKFSPWLSQIQRLGIEGIITTDFKGDRDVKPSINLLPANRNQYLSLPNSGYISMSLRYLHESHWVGDFRLIGFCAYGFIRQPVCLLENITMIYHNAAMVQFTDSMTLALKNNTKATYMLLNFAKRMKKLQLFLYVSTAFSNMNIPCEEAIEEVIPATIDWRHILKLLETEPLMLEALKEKLLLGQPNPYTWSKWLSEQIVNDYRIYFPTVITRPASVTATIREPFPAWLDSVQGLYALVQAAGFGILRIAYSSWDSYIDYIPADAAINAMIVASWKKHKEPAPDRTDVYNCCLVKDVPVKMKDFVKFGRSTIEKAPSKHIQWPIHITVTTNEILYRILFLLLQLLPAAIGDLINLMQNKKRRAVRMTIKLANVLRIFKKFSSKQLAFPNEKYKALNYIIPQEEWDVFNTVYDGINEEDFLSLGYESVMKYYLKEKTDEESMIKNRRRYFWLVVIDQAITACVWIGGIFLLTKIIGSMM